ncbi:hypothetical protein GGH93_004602 [Coemansia aciculifera]|nr:hypothetical protein GGH93_004602 [Coemansia aciculifera]
MPPTGTDQPLISEHKRLELSAASIPPAMQILTLDTAQTATGCKQFLCQATPFVLGEDVEAAYVVRVKPLMLGPTRGSASASGIVSNGDLSNFLGAKPVAGRPAVVKPLAAVSSSAGPALPLIVFWSGVTRA